MFVNTYSIIDIFSAGVAVLLGIYMVAYSLRIWSKGGTDSGEEARTFLEDRTYLLLLVAVVVLLLRLLSWPLFYAALSSFVAGIEGAMCIFGVTGSLPVLAKVIEIVKPLMFFAVGGWLMVHWIDSRSRFAPLMRKKLLLLTFVSLVVVADSLLELLFLVKIKPTFVVTCCTTVADVAGRITLRVPTALLGEDFLFLLKALFFLTNSVLIAFIAFCLFKGCFQGDAPVRSRLLLAGVVLGAVNLVVTLFALIEWIAPLWMELPYHHCIYCFLVFEDAPLALGLFVLGTFALGWSAVLRYVSGYPEIAPISSSIIRKNYVMAFFFLSAFLEMVLIHLIMVAV
jgi:hypothetical protein